MNSLILLHNKYPSNPSKNNGNDDDLNDFFNNNEKNNNDSFERNKENDSILIFRLNPLHKNKNEIFLL